MSFLCMWCLVLWLPMHSGASVLEQCHGESLSPAPSSPRGSSLFQLCLGKASLKTQIHRAEKDLSRTFECVFFKCGASKCVVLLLVIL